MYYKIYNKGDMFIMYCVKCGQEIHEDWNMCPKCGVPFTGTNIDDSFEPPIENIILADKEYTTAKNMPGNAIADAMSSFIPRCLMGVGVGIYIYSLISSPGFFTFILCALILFWIVSPLISMFRTFTGKCPYCGIEFTATERYGGLTCKSCKNRIVVRNDKFYKIN